MRLKKLLGFVKEYHSTIGSVLVVLILVGVCLFTVIDKKLQKTTEHGRMVQLTPLYKDAPEVPHYYKVAYSTLNIDANVAESGNFRDSVGAFSGNNLTEQQQKDKAALEALIASNNAVDVTTAKDAAKDRRDKYKLNKLGEENASTDISISPRMTASGGNVQYGTGGSYLGRFLLTGYCPCAICCGKTNGITASGKPATPNHTIAADKRYAFGTQMVINGIVYTVEDRGGAITGNHIDIFFNTHAEALAWGKRYGDVYLYTGGGTTATANTNSGSTGNTGSTGATGSVTLIGDSLTVGCTSAFKGLVPDANVDGVVGRQMSAGFDVVSGMKSAGTLGNKVIIELGTNGVFSQEDGQRLIDSIGSDKQIYWVNTYGPSLSWYSEVNAVISALCSANSNVTLIDWASVGQAHPEYFAGDGIHMTGDGYSAYAQLMYNSL